MQRQWPGSDQDTPVVVSTIERIPALVRELVEEITNGVAPSDLAQPNESSEEIILDVELDGARYMLIRLYSKPPDLQMKLSPRELEIARMVAQGYPNKTIAAVLEISSWTVSTHLRRIFAKLGVSARAAMVARLLKDGALGDRLKNSERVSDCDC